jgi:peptidyl-prolyl cis-trans isomerase C
MYLITGTIRAATFVPVLLTSLACFIALASANADTVMTVNGADVDSTVVHLYIQSRTNKPAAAASADEREALLRELSDIYLLTTQDVVAEIQKDPGYLAQIELQRRGVLAQAVASRFCASVAISDEEIQKEYESQVKLAPPLQFKARHILVESQGEAADLIKELDSGKDFVELATTRSTGPSAPNGGDLGWFSPNQMVPAFSDAVAKLQDGNYTKTPVQTEFGWHVILREESRESEAPPLDSVTDEIRQALQQKKFQAHLEKLRGDANDKK